MIPVKLREPKYPPIFILSWVRSGSTLLRYVLDTHSRICSPGELVLGRLCNDLQFVLQRTAGANESNDIRRQVRRIVGGVMGSYAQAKGKDLWCDKTPLNLCYLHDLENTFPEARFICLHRNCLDVVYSCIQASQLGFMSELAGYVCRNPGNVVAGLIDSWIEKTGLLLDLERRRPESCYRVKYEALVSQPEQILAPLLAFLGVDWEPDLVSRVFRTKHDPGGGDPKILLTSGFRISSIGRGSLIPFSSIPPDRLPPMNALLSNLGYPEIAADPNDDPTRHLAPGNRHLTGNVDEYFVHHLPKKIYLNAQELKQVSGSIRYIINGSEPSVWTLNLDQGKIEISSGDGAADCTVITDRETLLRLVNNESSMIEEILKDRLRIEGDIRLAHVAELVV